MVTRTKTRKQQRQRQRRRTVVVPLDAGSESDSSQSDFELESKKPHRRKREEGSRPLNLLTDSYAPKTFQKYRRAVADFVLWCDEQGVSDLSSFEQLDLTLFDYIQNMYVDKMNDSSAPGGKGKAKDTLYGVMMYLPRARFELMTAARAVRNWHRLDTGVSYPPLRKDLALLVAVRMMARGHRRAAIATLLAFDCLLRISEFCELVASDVADVGDARAPSELKQMSIRLAKTKTGSNQFVLVRDPAVQQLVRHLLAETPKKAKLFSYTSDQYRRLFKQTCADLKLSSAYVPHSLRHGGATHMHMVEGHKIEEVMVYGRWASLKSTRRYIQSGRALLLTIEVPEEAAALARRLSVAPAKALAFAESHSRRR